MRSRGFTLIELVITMVALAILALGVTSYIGLGARMYSDTAEREQVLGQSRFVAERMVRELRNATPNSIRVATQGTTHCVEFTPVITGGVYIDAPIEETKTYLWAVDNGSSIPNRRLVIYPRNTADIYDSSRAANTQITGTAAAGVPTGAIQINFVSHSFGLSSPEKRFYILDNPVSYCLIGSNMYRFSNYGFNTIQSVSLAGGVLMAEGLRTATFRVFPAVLTRNSVVNFFLQFGYGSNNDMFFNYEVHIPNVP